MKKRLIIGILIVVVIIGIFSVLLISRGNYNGEASLGETFKVPLNKTINVSNGLLKVKLLNANDSRCKEGWECIWSGEISYQLSINGEKLELGTVNNKEVDYKDYIIFLDDNNDSNKYVIIKIDKK